MSVNTKFDQHILKPSTCWQLHHSSLINNNTPTAGELGQSAHPMMPESGDEHDMGTVAAMQQHQQHQIQLPQQPSKQQVLQQPQLPLPQRLSVVIQQPQQPQSQQLPPHSSISHRQQHQVQQQQQRHQLQMLGDQQQQQHEQQQRQQDHEQQLQSADDKFQAAEALNSAFCRHIYSTALEYLLQQRSSHDLQREFDDIVDGDDPYDQPCTVAHQDVNSCKNRYRDVVPYDHNRVCLPPSPQPAAPAGADGRGQPAAAAAVAAAAAAAAGRAALGLDHGTTDYINASFMSDPQLTGNHAALQGYIATQGPLPCTVIDFWRMVAATNTSAIVMLTGLSDGSPTLGNSKPRCAPYFPDNEQDVLRLPTAKVTCVHKTSLDQNVQFRQLEVFWIDAASSAAAGSSSSIPSGAATAAADLVGAAAAGSPASRQLQQQPSQPPQRLWINHYEYMGWPDYGVPTTTGSVLALCHALDGCRRAGCKIVVHCSAGVGRTGTFIAIDMLLQRLHSLSLQLHGSVCDDDVIRAMGVPDCVMGLRKQRWGTVQTADQYSFIWQAVMDELQSLLQQQEEQQPPTLALPSPQQQQQLDGAAADVPLQ